MTKKKLLQATKKGLLDDVKRLLADQVDVDCVDNQKHTPLMFAALKGHDKIARLLIDSGAQVNSVDQRGRTSLIRAATQGHEKIAHLLIENGAQIDAADKDQWTPLMRAADKGHDKIVQLLVAKGAQVDFVNKTQATPLMRASLKGHDEVARLLIRSGAQVDAADKNSSTSLIQAATFGHDKIVRLLIKYGAQVNAADKEGTSSLMWAAIKGHAEAVQALIDYGALIDARDEDQLTPLMWAARNGHCNIVHLLIRYGAQVNAINKEGISSLMWAASEGHTDAVQALIKKDAFVNGRDENQQTPLMYASTNGHRKIVQLLIKSGAQVDAKSENHQTPVFWAVKNGHDDIVRLLIDNGASIDAADEQRIMLIWTAKCRDAKNVDSCMDSGAEVDAEDSDQLAPLMWAARNGHGNIVRLLINYGAKVNSRDKEGISLLMWAASGGHIEAVQALIDNDARVNAKDKNWQTPLMYASRNGHRKIVELLIKRRAQVNSYDKDKKTALVEAARYGHDNIVQLLIENGAEVNGTDECKRTPLIWAAMEGRAYVVQVLEGNYASADARDENQQATLIWASRNGHIKNVRLLIKSGACVNETDEEDTSLLMWTASEGHSQVAEELLKKEAQVNATAKDETSSVIRAAIYDHDNIIQVLINYGAQDKFEKTSLKVAARRGHTKIVQLLIQNGAKVKVNTTDKYKRTPLMYAAMKGHDDVVRLLLCHGADVNATDNDEKSALILATEKWCVQIVELLVSHGANINATNKDGKTPLILTACDGRDDIAQLLIDHEADMNATDNDGKSALILAVEQNHIKFVQLLINHGAKVNATDNDEKSALMLAAEQHCIKIVQLLIDNGADVNATDNDGKSALILATEMGHDQIVRLLIKHKASLDATNDNGQTALMLAVSEGRTKVVQALLSKGASIEVRDNQGETALMYAVDGNYPDIVHDILSVENGMNQAMALMKRTVQKQRRDAAARRKAREKAANAEAKIEDLLQLCAKMNEAQTICVRFCSRLLDMKERLSTLNELTMQYAVLRFEQLVDKARGFMIKYAGKHVVSRFVVSQAIIDTARGMNRELDAFLLQFNIESEEKEIHDWKSHFDKDSKAMKTLLNDSLKQTSVLSQELRDPQVQKEALMLLMFMCKNHSSQYSDEDMKLINRIFKYVSSMSKLKIESVPEWFVPPHEVQSNASFAQGSYGSVHRGTWNGVSVVVKRVFLEDQTSLELFLNETNIWFKLHHPHIVQLFRACHVGNPFFVCDWASNGTLPDYLCRGNNKFETWTKLHEAAMGLEYLHTKMKVVHGDLKCNNILIGTDRKAKLTDFGLSFVLGSKAAQNIPLDEVGAINWKAPEVISGKTRGTSASDVYSFGMCIIEAVTDRAPWGMMPYVAVKFKTVKQKSLPMQPPEMSDKQWGLVKRMCAWEPADRINITDVVKLLADLATEESILKGEIEWAEHKAKSPDAQFDPTIANEDWTQIEWSECGVDKPDDGEDNETPPAVESKLATFEVDNDFEKINEKRRLEETTEEQLLTAAKAGRLDDVKRLLDDQIDVDYVDDEKCTPLRLAAEAGHADVVQLLIDQGAVVDAIDEDRATILMLAAAMGHENIIRLLIDHGAQVNAVDKNQWTPLMWAAQNGRNQVVQILMNASAAVNATTTSNQTALMIAAESGYENIVKTLIEHGALIDAKDHKQQTALMLAASQGYTAVVQMLLSADSSSQGTNYAYETAMMYAIENNHQDSVLELMRLKNGTSHAMRLLKLGVLKQRLDVEAKEKANKEALAEVKVADLVQLCSKAHEAQTICEHIYGRLVDMEKQLATVEHISKQEVASRFKELVSKTHGFMLKHADNHIVTRFLGSGAIINSLRELNRELDAFLQQLGIPFDESESLNWKTTFDEESADMKLKLNRSFGAVVLKDEIQDPQVQKEALTLLMFEFAKNSSEHSAEELALIRNIFKSVSSMSQIQITGVPPWFVPPHHVAFDVSKSFARGSYGSIHHGTWNGTIVVVKSASMAEDNSRVMFINETNIWFKLHHPHVVHLFRACHVGNPFFVCEWASNGTLPDYLCLDNNRLKTWAKLHEAAQGLQYLHSMKVVHGDLKCNNILVSADGTAKLTDFGLSFVLGSKAAQNIPLDEVGAINWKAPEVISRETRGTFASDVYSFGMCIIEAVTTRPPWGMTMAYLTVKHKVANQKTLPMQPPEMNNNQWDLVKRMCAWDPNDRIDSTEVVKLLADLATEESILNYEVLWGEHKAYHPVAQCDPTSSAERSQMQDSFVDSKLTNDHEHAHQAVSEAAPIEITP